MRRRRLQQALIDALGPSSVITEPAALRTYEMDALTTEAHAPSLVVLPRNTADCVAIMQLCAEAGAPIVPRGAGTGLSGGALPTEGSVVVVMTRMNSILAIDAANRLAVVQPGVTNLAISHAVAAHDLYFAPDPSSQIVCTIGGNVAENSGGAHCLKYGFTTHHVLELEVVLGDGTLTRFGSAMADAPGYDLRGLFIGSEGTLGLCTEVTVRLLRKPEGVRTLVADFDSCERAGDAVTAIVVAGLLPAAMEMMDTLAIEACERSAPAGFRRGIGAALIVELDGPEMGLDDELQAVRGHCLDSGATAIRVAQSATERADIWRGRKAAFAAMGRLAPSYLVQDGVIPRTKLGAVLAEIARLAREAELRVANVFHAGDGNLHPLVLYDGADEAEAERAALLSRRIAELCVEHGGSITGEHGVGTDKACSMPKMFSEDDLALMLRARDALDPQGQCNPEKQFPTPRLCGEKPGPYRPHPLEAEGIIERW